MSFTSSDADQYLDCMGAALPGMTARPLYGTSISSRTTAARLPGLYMFTTQLGNIRMITRERTPVLGVTIPLDGICMMNGSGNGLNVLPGTFHVADGEKPFEAVMTDEECKFLGLVIDKEKVEPVLRCYHGERSRPTALREIISPGRTGAVRFMRTTCELWDTLRHSDIAKSPTAMLETTDRLICEMLEASIIEEPGDQKVPENERAAAAAAEYIVENLDGNLSRAEIANNTGTSVRSLTRNFRKRYGVSIRQFIIEQRLEAANRALLTSDPDEVSVTKTATRFGFWHLGRFSSYFRDRFGEIPSSRQRQHDV